MSGLRTLRDGELLLLVLLLVLLVALLLVLLVALLLVLLLALLLTVLMVLVVLLLVLLLALLLTVLVVLVVLLLLVLLLSLLLTLLLSPRLWHIVLKRSDLEELQLWQTGRVAYEKPLEEQVPTTMLALVALGACGAACLLACLARLPHSLARSRALSSSNLSSNLLTQTPLEEQVPKITRAGKNVHSHTGPATVRGGTEIIHLIFRSAPHLSAVTPALAPAPATVPIVLIRCSLYIIPSCRIASGRAQQSAPPASSAGWRGALSTASVKCALKVREHSSAVERCGPHVTISPAVLRSSNSALKFELTARVRTARGHGTLRSGGAAARGSSTRGLV